MQFQQTRACGVLLPVSSLPGPYGIGDLGEAARRFVDFLADAGQRYWQILPIGPTGYGDSPYQSFCAFAGNPYFIDLSALLEAGLLTQNECGQARRPVGPVDYRWLYDTRVALLKQAASRMVPDDGFNAFCETERWWLDDYALFMAIKEAHGDVSWQQWPDPLRRRDPAALWEAGERLAAETVFWQRVQYLFSLQWRRLKEYANGRGVSLIGDIPIYVSPDSSDVWAGGPLFQLDENRRQTQVAGVPPDAFSADGQVWGNPLYDWDYHAKTGFDWWAKRLRHAGSVYDVTRIDHFRGFCDYFAIPAGEPTARNGCWHLGPGKAFIDATRQSVPQVQIIAEDLGFLSPQVAELLAHSGFPGMKVLQFAFDSREAGDYLPYRYGPNSVVYTGTHDNTTTADWEFSAPPEDVVFAKRFLDVHGERTLTQAMIRAALASVSFLAVIPLQDWLELGGEARINTPSTLGGNWIWRVEETALSPVLAAHMAGLAGLYGRSPRR